MGQATGSTPVGNAIQNKGLVSQDANPLILSGLLPTFATCIYGGCVPLPLQYLTATNNHIEPHQP